MTEISRGPWGCLRIAAAACVLFLLLITSGCLWQRWNESLGQLPDHLKISKVMTFRSSGWLREGCVYGVYVLAPETFEALRRDGIAFLGRNTHSPKENPRNPYGGWQDTPAIDRPVALAADNGCDDGRSPRLPDELQAGDARRAMERPENFYAVTTNREGLIVLDVRRGLAFVLYFG